MIISTPLYAFASSANKSLISLNNKARNVAEKYSNVEREVYGKSYMGRDLEAYVINGLGDNSKTIFCTFAIHGFEDFYDHDGKVLTKCANDLIEHYAENPVFLKNCRLVIVPCVNPDGTIDGKNNNRANSTAFGRCTADHVDMNRDFRSDLFKAQESRALRDLIEKYDPYIFIDFHGWLNSVLGNPELVSAFRSTNNISRDQSNRYGIEKGYLFGWVKDNFGSKSALVEFKDPKSVDYKNVAKGLEKSISNLSDYIESSSIPKVNNVKGNIADGKIPLSWDALNDVRGYEIQWNQNGKWENYAYVNQNSILIQNLDPNSTYLFRVRGYRYISGYWVYSSNWSDPICYSKGQQVFGWFDLDGKRYYFDENGSMLKGLQKIKNNWYYFDDFGVMHKGWLYDGDCWRYFKNTGEMAIGFETVNKVKYYFNESGEMITGWRFVNDKWYYFENSGAMHFGWLNKGNAKYYFKDNGEMAVGLETINKEKYYFNELGEMITGWRFVDDKWYYFENYGGAHIGWLKKNDIWYYFKPNAEMAVGLETVNNEKYYFNELGEMITGWRYVNDKWYYFESYGGAHIGWLKKDNNWYYFKQNAEMVVGLNTINNQKYYFNELGEMITGWRYVNDNWYYFKESGEAVSGFKTIKGSTYYFFSDGKMATGNQIIDGKEYDFGTDGVCRDKTKIKVA